MTDEQHLIELLTNPATQREGFEIMVREYSEKLYWHVRRIVLSHDDADDVMQNVMLKAWLNLETFRKDSKISTWLYRITINECLDFVRRKKHITELNADDAEGFIANTLIADSYFDGDQTAAQLQEAIAKLPDVQRTVFTLRYYDNMKYSEMSTLLGTTESALKASYHFAVKKISDFFKQRD